MHAPLNANSESECLAPLQDRAIAQRATTLDYLPPLATTRNIPFVREPKDFARALQRHTMREVFLMRWAFTSRRSPA